MNKYLEEQFPITQLTAELSNKDMQFYFAINNSQVVGYLKLNIGNSQTELQDGNGLEIERIYVATAFQNKQVGQMLFNQALQIANENNINFIWLGVWEKNPKAIQFYKKNGFIAFDKHVFILGDDKQTDIMMKLNLNA
jgi:diamine N-acetyltransferase